MLDRLRALWAERPAVVAAAVIAPIAFVVTLLILFVAVGNTNSGTSQDQSVAQETQGIDGGQQAQTSTTQQTTVVVDTSSDDDQQDSVSEVDQQTSGQDEGQSSAEDPGVDSEPQQDASEDQQSQVQQQQAQEDRGPRTVGGWTVQPLDSVLVQEYDEESLRHGTDGMEGGILPIDNGVVVSSQPEQRTAWELIVPSAGLKSTIVTVGRTPNGAMGSPDNPFVIGWLNSSAEPGAVGNTLLAGHRDFEDKDGNVGTGVCWELVNTVVGDQMIVVDKENDLYYVYTVTEAATVNPRDPDSARYLRNTDEAVVTLITCEGSFNAETHQYSHRRVVVGVLSAVASPDA
jgi:sortase (surface protein transpeptidase)